MAPMPDRTTLGSVDAARERSISFARPERRPSAREIVEYRVELKIGFEYEG